MTTLTLCFDIIVIGLLLAALPYTILLNRRLQALSENKETLTRLLENFSDSLLTAESTLAMLQKGGSDAAAVARQNMREAQQLHDDLEMLLRRGAEAADALEKTLKNVRTMQTAAAPAFFGPDVIPLQQESQPHAALADLPDLGEIKKKLAGKLNALR